MESRAVVGSMVHPLSMLASPASRFVSGPAARSPVIVSYLEMRDARALRPKFSSDPRFQIRECTVPQWRFNRFLYEAVGAEWQWNDKRVWSDEQWREYVESPQLRTFAATYDGSPAGYYELSRTAEPDEVEVMYFGLLPAFIGRGWGGVLLTRALETAWEMRPSRVWLHTCTLDHPMAIRNYLARGLTLYKVE